jgi:hypothetical protein
LAKGHLVLEPVIYHESNVGAWPKSARHHPVQSHLQLDVGEDLPFVSQNAACLQIAYHYAGLPTLDDVGPAREPKSWVFHSDLGPATDVRQVLSS